MQLLGAVNYDPGTAVSKVTTSLLAMTALDTANLRIAFTIPAHGYVRVRMVCVHHGSTTTAQFFLGVLEGATLRGRQMVQKNLLGTAIATTQIMCEADYIIGGLTPGAVNWDAAYGVEIVSSAGGAVKYGGPNNTTTNDAFGGFCFEVWDPKDGPTNWNLLSVDANGRVDVIKVAGTTQTARDLGLALPAAAPDAVGGLPVTGTRLTSIPWNAAWDAEVQSEVANALNVDTYAEPGQAAPPATASIVAKVGYLYKAWRNRSTQDATTYKLYADDATTVDQKKTVSDNGTTFDSGEAATGP